jgi:hypothetical protein
MKEVEHRLSGKDAQELEYLRGEVKALNAELAEL